MSKSKADKFNKKDVFVADIAKALSHPARIRILDILNNMKVCMTGDIVDLLPLSQSTVSQHLKELRRVGLIQGEVEGPKTCYCLDNKMLAKVKNEFNKLFKNICNC